ncbi:glycyl-tRNA synthetase beta chain [Elusimicrobium simillimum]|uniref:glycine--tRNA ligase subunit beta n=1 Tax=Elusimicrobium simillimum TaxID=3143438 RepID=UPI003C6FF888
MTSQKAFLEIGVEHLPARFVPGTLAQMEALAKAQMAEHNIVFTSVRAFGSFRKLALVIDGVEPKAQDIVKEVKGPPAKLLKDAAGNYTPQSAGFAQKNGIKPEKLTVVDTPNGPFIYAKVKIKGEAVKKLLPQIFTNIVRGLQFPKTMTWEQSGLRFGRPLRTLIGLYGDALIKFNVAEVESGRVTWPLSSFGTKGIKIQNADTYTETLRNQAQPILIEPQDRKEVLVKAITKEGALRNLTAVIDEDLLTETVFMTEHPVVVPGDFEIRFLTLPKELIITVLKKQIKMFHMVNAKGDIEPYFIAVRDGMSVNQNEVMKGFKKVMSARLSDAVFFYNQDIKKGLKTFRDKLSAVQFIDGIGTMLDKTERTKTLAVWLAEKCGADKTAVSQAADYAYADLTSGVVYEFPELQGYMGGVYAAKEGFGKEVAKAIEEFYYPLTSASQLPSNIEGAVLSIAGKMDTIAGNFAVGQIPTGSEDPFALRRQAIGIVRMLAELDLPVSLHDLIEHSASLYGDKFTTSKEDLVTFFKVRVENILEAYDMEKNVMSAVSYRLDRPVKEIVNVALALKNLRHNEELAAVSQNAKRVLNILKKAEFETAEVNTKYFEHDAEKALHAKLGAISAEIKAYENKALTTADAEKIFALLATLKAELANFFDAVMVNAENKEVRLNRLNLLFNASAILTKIADITALN